MSETLGKTYYIMLVFMIITGTFNTVFTKLQNSYYDQVAGASFSHPWFQSLLMFIGEFYCAIIWLFAKSYFRSKEDEEKKEYLINNPRSSIATKPELPEVSPFLFLITCLCDVIGTTLLNFALLMMAGSVFQMLRGGIIIVTCVFLILFLKKHPKNYQWLGVGIVFIGIFIVGLSSQLDNHNSSKKKEETKPLGIILLIFSLLFQGFQFIYQEKILLSYKCHPMQLVAWEGTWGILIFVILLPIFQFIPCNFEGMDKVCSGNAEGKFYLENTSFALKQTTTKIPLLLFAIGQTFSIGAFNFFGIMLVKYSSAAARAVMDSGRTVLVWLFFLVVPMASGDVLEHFLWLELIGFIVMVGGQLIYNGLIPIPIFGFDKHLKVKPKDEENNLITHENTEDEEEDTVQKIDLRRSFVHS